jgi:hypothetical protein
MSTVNAELEVFSSTVSIGKLLHECDVLSDSVPKDSALCKLVLLLGVDGLRSMLDMPDDELAEVWPEVKLTEEQRKQVGKTFEVHFSTCVFCQDASVEGRRLERAVTRSIVSSSPSSARGANRRHVEMIE